jgi:hypothetical protein
MFTLTLVAGLWISLMMVILPQVLAHPHAIEGSPYKQRPVRRRNRA